MKITAFFLLLSMCSAFASTKAQQISLKENKTPLRVVLDKVRQQSNYDFVADSKLLENQKSVTITLTKVPLADALSDILEGTNLQFEIINHAVVITEKKTGFLDRLMNQIQSNDVNGVILTVEGKPLVGASVKVRSTNQTVYSDANGAFSLKNVADNAVIQISFIGYVNQELRWKKNMGKLTITMEQDISKLDEVAVQAYKVGSQRLATSNISRITADELDKQPVTNVLQALEGRIAGMVVNQTTGVPGARVNVQIRGRSNFDRTITSDQPLFIIDGVPMAANNDRVNIATGPFSITTGEGLSAFAGIDPTNIESIDVLKDADATAIYGSRGANGVVLITTKRGKVGKLRLSANVSTGVSVVSQIPEMLNTEQYLMMRNEAFTNDGTTKTNANAYDLLLWDQNRYTNFAELLVGHSAPATDAQVNFSGGTQRTQYRMGASYHKEGTVWGRGLSMDRTSLNFNLKTTSEDEKFTADFSAMYGLSNSDLVAGDLAAAIVLPPNYKLFDERGNLSWNEGGYNNNRDNPLAQLNQKYLSKMNNLNVGALLNYVIIPGLNLRGNFGYNLTQNDDRRITPIASQNPTRTSLAGQSNFGTGTFRSWIVEPQLNYNRQLGIGKLDVLVGATYNVSNNATVLAVGNGYSSDDLLNSLSGASNIVGSNTFAEYKYQAFFGRINYNIKDTYLVNFTGRRDGSSRFGPQYRFSNFGAVGAGWIFSNEKPLKNSKVLSYGKLRASYGVTGNDQISNYLYMDTWTAGSNYTDSTTLMPSKLFNPDLHWERNVKTEIGLELGFFNDRILFTTSAYYNISSDPLVSYPLPRTTGFATVTSNLTGVEVLNKGLEFTLTTKNFRASAFTWSTDFNFTIPRNSLKKYPNLETSSYATSYTIGRPLNQLYAAKYLGVDPTTGLYKVLDVDGNNSLNAAADFMPGGHTDPKFYGGLNNSFSYKGFSLSVFLQFTKQMGRKWTNNNLYNQPGSIFNVPTAALDRWQQVGQEASVQKFTTSAGSILGTSGFYAYMFSDGFLTDASYLRVKNAQLSYQLPASLLSKLHLNGLRVYVQGQNLFVFTPYKVSDPEVQNYTRMAPLRTIVGGLQLTL